MLKRNSTVMIHPMYTVSVEVSETKCIYPECNQTSNIIKASFAPPKTIKQAVGISLSNDLLFCKGTNSIDNFILL